METPVAFEEISHTASQINFSSEEGHEKTPLDEMM
jgi:hypothetical protein